jgi:hypothetical protein
MASMLQRSIQTHHNNSNVFLYPTSHRQEWTLSVLILFISPFTRMENKLINLPCENENENETSPSSSSSHVVALYLFVRQKQETLGTKFWSWNLEACNPNTVTDCPMRPRG